MLRDQQREYARRKRAPGRRKVSKAERQLLEEQYSNKKKLVEAADDQLPIPGIALSRCVISSLSIWFSHRHQVFTRAHLLCVRELWIPDAQQG